MAKSHHLSRKELKEDIVKDAGLSIYEYAQEHAHQILTGALLVVLVLVAMSAFKIFRASNAERAADQLHNIQKSYLNVLPVSDASARTAALEDTISTCDSVAKTYGSSEVGHEALFIKANCLYLKESYDEAIKVYEQYQAKSATNDDRAKALVAIGYCYEDQAFFKQNDKALLAKAKESFEKAAGMSKLADGKASYQKSQAELGLVRIEIALGNLVEAKKLAEAVKAERKDTSLGKEKKFAEGDFANYQTVNRLEKARMIRQWSSDKRAGLTFEKRAEGDLEEIESRLKMPAGAAAAALPVITADAPSTKTVSAVAPVAK